MQDIANFILTNPDFLKVIGVLWQIFVFFIIAVAAAEVAVGLAIIVALFRLKQTVRVSDITTLKL